MNVTNDPELAQLLHEVSDEDAAMADLDGCVARLHRARDAKIALAKLSPTQVRAALQMRRAILEAGQP